METKQALEKWLNNEATPADMQVLNAWPEFDFYKKIDAHTKRWYCLSTILHLE